MDITWGRKITFDERSRSFPLLALSGFRPARVKHRLYGRKLNQGSIGACVGYSWAHCYNGHPRPGAPGGWRSRTINQIGAQLIYAKATSIDEFGGTWRPDDTGTSVLAGNKAAVWLKVSEGYRWAFGLEHALSILPERPLQVGTWWTEGMMRPDFGGLIRYSGARLGGHAWTVTGYDDDEQVVFARNSWGTGWGNAGNFVVSYADLGRLLADDGEACAPVASRLTTT